MHRPRFPHWTRTRTAGSPAAGKSDGAKEELLAEGYDMSQSDNGQGGVGFAGLLAIAFIVLKLTGVIAWSWWWVLSPLWIGAAIALVGVVLALVIFGVAKLVKR